MKRMLKTVRFLVKPFGKRGFSRVDLVILLFLALIVIVDLLLHAFQPASVARAFRPALVQAQVQSTSKQVDAPSAPRVPASSHRSSAASAPNGLCFDPFNTATCSIFSSHGPACHSPTITSPFSLGNVKSMIGDNDVLFFFTNRSMTVDECHIQITSGIMVMVVNAFGAIVLMLAGLRIMLGGSVLRYAHAIEVLPGILLALLAANLCMPIASLSIDLNNALSIGTYNALANMAPSAAEMNGSPIITKTCNNWWTVGGAAAGAVGGAGGGAVGALLGAAAGGALGRLIGCDWGAHKKDWEQGLQQTAQLPNITGSLFAFKALTDLLGFITGILVLMLMGQMALRLLFINLYIATGPLGLGAWALPGSGGKWLTKLWLQGFFSNLFVQFLQVIALIVVRMVIGAITSGLYASLQGPNGSAVNDDATLLWVMQIVQYWFILRLPSLLSTGPMSSMNMLVGFGQTLTQTAQAAIAISMAEIQFAISAGTSAASAAIIR